MNGFTQFMASGIGRIIRIVAGIVLILVGALLIKGTGGIIVAVIGLVPLAAGVFDFCLAGPLFGGPLSGAKLRAGRK